MKTLIILLIVKLCWTAKQITNGTAKSNAKSIGKSTATVKRVEFCKAFIANNFKVDYAFHLYSPMKIPLHKNNSFKNAIVPETMTFVINEDYWMIDASTYNRIKFKKKDMISDQSRFLGKSYQAIFSFVPSISANDTRIIYGIATNPDSSLSFRSTTLSKHFVFDNTSYKETNSIIQPLKFNSPGHIIPLSILKTAKNYFITEILSTDKTKGGLNTVAIYERRYYIAKFKENGNNFWVIQPPLQQSTRPQKSPDALIGVLGPVNRTDQDPDGIYLFFTTINKTVHYCYRSGKTPKLFTQECLTQKKVLIECKTKGDKNQPTNTSVALFSKEKSSVRAHHSGSPAQTTNSMAGISLFVTSFAILNRYLIFC